MEQLRLSGSLVALALAAALVAPSAIALAPSVRSVGEIFVDAHGRASGQNLVTRIDEAAGAIQGFRSPSHGVEVFSGIVVDGFAAAEKIQGAGSSSLTLKGSNAIVTLHDNTHSVVKIVATKPTLARYQLGEDVVATKEGANGGRVSLSHPTRGELGSIVAYGAEGTGSKGEVLDVKGREVVARLQTGSEILFLGNPSAARGAAYQSALVEAIAQGALLSHYITEFEGSDVRTSQVDAARATVRTTAESGAGVSSTIRAASAGALAYDLAYETLPVRSADDVAVFLDGERAPARVWVADGRTRLLTDVPAGEHRVSVGASAHASTESQARAEESGDDGSRVYGGFEYHANGKLTGEFVTGVIPDGHATLLRFTALASRTEVFESVSVDGGAGASFHAAGVDEMRLQSQKADLTLVDDVHATLIVAAKAPTDATFKLASGIVASASGERILHLGGPHGPAGALVLVGDGSLASGADGVVRAKLAHGSRLVYRGASDGHPSENAVLAALSEGRVGAQLLAGLHEGALATKTTRYADDVGASIRPSGRGALLVTYVAQTESAARGLVLDVRGASLAAKAASDIRVTVDGEEAAPVPTPEDALDAIGFPRYHTMTSPDGALRVIVNTASATSATVSVVVSSTLESAARENARTDAFGAFRLYHDGTAVGSFVTLKADRAAGAISGFTMIASERPIFASLAAGSSPFLATAGDGASVLRLENREARAEFSDTTSGFAKITALADMQAAIRLAAGLRAEQRGAGVVELLDERGEQVGSIIIVAGQHASALEARGQGDVRASLANGAVMVFRAHSGIESELSAAQRTMIDSAIAGGRVAGHVIVQSQADFTSAGAALEQTAREESDGLSIAALEAFGEITSSVTASYGAVNILTAATKERVEITVGSALHEGKTLIVSLDPDTIPGMAKGKATIRFDGEIVGQASSYADILDPSDDGGVAEYFVLAGEAGTQVLVSIPHFSVHTVTLEQQTSEGANSLYMYATLFLGMLVVVESALLARGRKKNDITSIRRP